MVKPFRSSRFYIAYGANLHSRHLFDEKCGIGKGALVLRSRVRILGKDARFVRKSRCWAGGVLSLVDASAAGAPGLAFEILDWNVVLMLDPTEEARHACDRQAVFAALPSGQLIRALTYVAKPVRQRDFVVPSASYLTVVRSGLRENSISADSLNRATTAAYPTSGANLLFVSGSQLRLLRDSLTFKASKYGSGYTVAAALYKFPVVEKWSEVRPFCQDRVGGTLWLLPATAADEVLKVLDALMGFVTWGHPDNRVVRTLVPVPYGDREILTAWAYV